MSTSVAGPARYRRVTLTKTQQASAAGAELLDLLTAIMADGLVEDKEIERLRLWLASPGASVDLPAVHLLRESVTRALEDGRITGEERAEIVAIILRVLPRVERDAVAEQMRSCELQDGEAAQFATGKTAEARGEDARAPKCKRWRLFVPGAANAFAVTTWQTVRLWRGAGVLPDSVMTGPEDESTPVQPITEWPFARTIPASVQREIESVLDEAKTTLGARTAVSPRQREVLKELGWTPDTGILRHYRHADWLIRWYAKQRGVAEGYDDPDSPWHWSAAAKPDPQGDAAATEAQLRYLRALGVKHSDNLTKIEASDLIDGALSSSRSVSNRQMMVLRFWNRLEVTRRGRCGVSEWMDQWYSEDPDREAAWTMWKEEHGDRGRQDDPERVPVGAGAAYLARVKSRDGAGQVAPRHANQAATSHPPALWKWILLIAIGVAIWLLLRRAGVVSQS